MRVEETLDLLDLAPLRERPLATLSGGEKQRVAIAAALALRPAILVLAAFFAPWATTAALRIALE